MPRTLTDRLIEVVGDEGGFQALEYTLLLTFIVLPLVQVVPYLLDMLRSYYELISFTVSLPFP